MVKIKLKKQMNLPQLIELAFSNDIKNKSYLTHDIEGNTSEVHFDVQGLPQFSSMVSKNNTFTVEVEKTVTEDTLFYYIIEITKDDTHLMWKHTNITEEKDVNSKEFHAYIDGEYKLIWRDGKLIKE